MNRHVWEQNALAEFEFGRSWVGGKQNDRQVLQSPRAVDIEKPSRPIQCGFLSLVDILTIVIRQWFDAEIFLIGEKIVGGATAKSCKSQVITLTPGSPGFP